MRQTKYIMSGGLAFAEDKDMEKLHQYSLKGWHVSDFKFMGYTLEKGESSNYIYSLDYRSLKGDEAEEYFDIFSSAGWTHVSSTADIHLFRADPGTKPIYSDDDTKIEKYSALNESVNKFAMPVVLITVLLWIGAMISAGTMKSVFLVGAAILSIIAIPTAWTALSAYNNKCKVKGRNRLVNLLKIIPIFLLLIAASILLVVDSSGSAVRTLASMFIGAIALPTVIWLIMSLYHKVGSAR